MNDCFTWHRAKRCHSGDGHEASLPRSLVHVLSEEDELESALERAIGYEQVAADRTAARTRHYQQMMNKRPVVVPMPRTDRGTSNAVQEHADSA